MSLVMKRGESKGKIISRLKGMLAILAFVVVISQNFSSTKQFQQTGRMAATHSSRSNSSTLSCEQSEPVASSERANATNQDLFGARTVEESYKGEASTSSLIPEDQLKFCQANNFMAHNQTDPLARTNITARKYSLDNRSFQRHHDRYCETSTELLQAIAKGHRSWGPELDAANLTTLERESMSSFFIPHGCDIPYLNSPQYCAAANQFTDIVIQGDSQSRHLQQAMFMAYRGDVVRGGLLPIDDDPQKLRCHCDGTYANSNSCRVRDTGIFAKFQPYQLYMCPQVQLDDQFTQHFSINRIKKKIPFNFTGINCTAPDYKGLLLYTQGGVHYRWNPYSTFNRFLKIILQHPVVQECAKVDKLTLIWSGYTAQSPTLDSKYTDQTMEAGLKFDTMMKEYMKDFAIPTIQWIPLTLGAVKGDGLHFTTDVNLERAQHVMVLATMVKKEGYRYKSLQRLISGTNNNTELHLLNSK